MFFAVITYSFMDMLHLITAAHNLPIRMAVQNPFLGQGWSIIAAACTMTLQLLVMLACRVLVSTLLAYGAVILLHQLMRGVQATALLMQLPTLQGLAVAMRLGGKLAGPAGAAAAAAAPAAAAQAGTTAAAAVLGTGAISSSSSGRLLGVATASLRGRTAAAAAKVAAGLGLDAAGTTAAAGVLRGWLLPWHAQLLSLHFLCEDLVMLTCARLVWETQEFVFDHVWRLLGLCVIEAHALFESVATAAAMMVMSGASAEAALARFRQLWPLQRQRRGAGANARDADDQRVQAQVFIQAPADMGQAAEALRTLADELEQLGVHPPMGGWGAAAIGGGGSRSRRMRQLLGQHWPSPLALPFDAEQLQSELGLEVPRGFVCPITQDIMRLPALLISSNVAVPATYDRDAISRWLEGNRWVLTQL
jgi:hypothetical protein